MRSAHSARGRGAVAAMAAVAVALSGAALYLGSGLHPVPWLTWLAPLPILLLAPRTPAPVAAVAAFVAWFAGEANMWNYLLNDIRLPPVILLFLAAYALLFALAVALYRGLLGRRRYALAALAVPAIWTSGEYVVSLLSPHGTFGSLAYSQADLLPVAQIASITGILGISFALMGVSSAVATLLAPGIDRRAALLVGIAAAIVATGTLGYGALRLAQPQAGSQARSVALVAVRPPRGEITASSPDGRALLDAYVGRVRAAAAGGADLVVLPEAILITDDGSLPAVDETLSRVATDNHVDVVVGLISLGSDGRYDVAVAFHAGGGPPTTYRKEHLIPGKEPYGVGHSLSLMAGPGGPWGMEICKDLDFPALSRAYGREGVGLMLVPAWDFESDGWLHDRMAVMRGVENGFSVARAGRRGVLSLSDPSGRVTAEASTGTVPSVTVSGELTPHASPTLYTRWGDWFAWLCCAISLAAMTTWLVGRRRRSPATPEVARQLGGAAETRPLS
jgi:apolipoprotein N-acyltransferase